MIQNLNNLLKEKTAAQICLIHAPDTCYPYVNFTLQYLYTQFGEVNRYKFVADRYFSFAEIHQILGNNSLFAEKNLIEISYKTKPTVAQADELNNLLERVDADTFFIVTTDKLTSLTSAWAKTFNQRGSIIGITEADTPTIIKHMITEAGLKINSAAQNLLTGLNQSNLAQLMQELNKLILLYPKGHEISVNDIQSFDNSQYNIYQLSAAYLSGDLKQSLKILDNIYTEPADAILIMWVINDDVRKLIKLKAKLKDKMNINDAIGELKVWGVAINNLKTASARVQYPTLMQLLESLATLDMMIKGVLNGDVRLHLTEMLTTLCKK